jgi:hypothetical protein
MFDAGMQAAVDRHDRDLATLRLAVQALIARDTDRQDAMVGALDSVINRLADVVALLQATIDALTPADGAVH